MPNDMTPLAQTQAAHKIEPAEAATRRTRDTIRLLSWREQLAAEPVQSDEPPSLAPADTDAPSLPIEASIARASGSIVRRLHRQASADRLDQTRGGDGLERLWDLRSSIRAGDRLVREKLKLRR